METFAIIVYTISDEVLRALDFVDDPQAKMSAAEIIAFALITAKYFKCNYKISRYICKNMKFFLNILSNSRLNRRIQKISWDCWNAIFRFLALIFKETSEACFAIDSFPVFSCQKNRIDKRKLFLGKEHIGYAASKKRYFCGIKVHMLVTTTGRPIEVLFRPGSESDLKALWQMELDIPPNSNLYADGAYNSFDLEDLLQDESIALLAKRSSKAKNRVRSREEERIISSKRQIIETAFSCITDLFPRNFRMRTEQGFLIKVFSCVLAYSMSFLCNNTLV